MCSLILTSFQNLSPKMIIPPSTCTKFRKHKRLIRSEVLPPPQPQINSYLSNWVCADYFSHFFFGVSY